MRDRVEGRKAKAGYMGLSSALASCRLRRALCELSSEMAVMNGGDFFETPGILNVVVFHSSA